ncbi:MarR family winged helix-turn-helix transcriptional regulator [Sediminispirochaeta smaragdinae]|uniref:Transcriptional regulator, MarR family n=1 Tax=Sediminispirochaeta smaragdinae (strain DSM 11293 / JCM 15392 / SEBR 4228) TaxID=573413 RepID=E1R792_SEDSS|nr:MarR family transcriptional regulator [Sediminispirochaeta smaragdinae]ADK82597.1 transcriptional regulator, MarR family [Sediminispirochaeta smaragdinae DSM 11293]
MDILIEDFMCLVEKIAATSKCSQRFDTDIEIYRSEIHVIKLLGDYASLHVSEIARKFGVTRGAASQILKRLEKKGLVRKYPDESNNTRILVSLTDKGLTAYHGHEEYHRRHDGEFFTFLEDLNTHELEVIGSFVEKFDKMMGKHV